jgi:hypothetical protein
MSSRVSFEPSDDSRRSNDTLNRNSSDVSLRREDMAYQSWIVSQCFCGVDLFIDDV